MKFLLILPFTCQQVFGTAKIRHHTFPVRFQNSQEYVTKTEHSPFFSSQNHLPVLADGQMALPSNANNFHGGWNTAVDPRTGNATFSLNTANLLYDNGRARRQLILSWAGSPVPGGSDSFGLGAHWSWNVGTEHPSSSEVAGHRTTDIVTGDGHAFTMVSDRSDQGKTVWHPLRHKLADVLITGHPGNWTIATAAGVREHILNGYEDWEESRDGHRLHFYYDRHGVRDTIRHLVCISPHTLNPDLLSASGHACRSDGIAISYDQGTVTVHGRQVINLYRRVGGGIARIGMPALDSNALAHHTGQVFITFDYDHPGNRPWLVRRVTYPAGMHTTFLYNGESSRSHMPYGIPVGINGAYLPVITEEITDSGNAAVPVKHLYYQYGRPGKDEHNYTGYQGNASVVPGRDNLFDRADDYAYQVTVDNGLTRTTTTYNKYHLPLTVIQREDRNQGIVAQSEQGYLPWRHTTFSSLSPQYSLAISTGKTLHALTENGTDPSLAPARVLQLRRYDRFGRVYWQQDAWGRQSFTTYCPPQGDAHCPASDADWPETARPEKVLVVPARHALSGIRPVQSMTTTEMARPVEVVFDYTRFKTQNRDHAGLHFWQVATKTTASLDPKRVFGLKPGDALPEPAADEVVTRTRYGYDSNPSSPVFGELKRIAVFRNPAPTPAVDGRFLHLAKAVRPKQASDEARFTVSHHIDPATGTRTTNLAIEGGNTTRHHSRNRMTKGQGLSLGTSVYSLATGLLLGSSDTLKTRHVTWQYDRWDRPVSRTVTPADTGKPRTTRWAWLSGHGEEAMVMTDPDGNQSKTVYAPGGEVLSTWHRFRKEAGQPLAGEAYWIADSRTGYTVTGKPSFHTVYHAADPVGQKPGKRITLTTTYGYDALNRPVWTRTPDGMIQVTVRDDPGLYQIQYVVATGGKERTLALAPMFAVSRANLLGKPVASYVLPTNPDARRGEHKIYNPALAEWLTKLTTAMIRPETLHATGSTGLLPVGGGHGLIAFVRKAISQKAWLTHTTTDYDGAGRRVRQTLGNGAVTRWHWQLGDLVAITAPDGRVIHDRYNVAGKKVARCVQPAGSTICHSLGTREYDAVGNLLWQADEYGHVIRHIYDADGRETGRDTPDGHHFHWKYSALGMTEADVDGTPYLSITYDPVTWQITDREDRVSHLHFTYDPHTGAPVRIIRSAPKHLAPVFGIAYPGGTETMTLDRYLSPVAVTDMHGNRFTVRHDNLGRVIQTQVQMNGSSTVHTLTSNTYDRFGRTATVANGIGLTRTFTYNPEGSLENTTDTMEGKTILKQEYVHDPDTGNLVKYVRSEGGETATQTYHYDINNNLTDMTCTPYSLCPRDTATVGSTLTTPPVIVAQHYRFDDWNNIVRVEEELQDSHGNRLTKTTHYTYAQKNPQADIPEAYDPHRLLGISTRWSNARFSTPAQEIRYDAMGRMIRDAEGDQLHYNAFGQQDRFINARTKETTHYIYDSDGHQVAEQPFDAKGHALQAPLYLYYSGNTITAQSQADHNGKIHVTTELAGVARSEDGEIRRWYLHDYKGDVLNSFDSAGQKLQDSIYSPYGMAFDRLNHSVQILPVFSSLGGETLLWQRHHPGFDGQMSDPATGYQFLGGGYRAYNPIYRHFMARDSFSPFTKIDGYGFGDNNPVMNTDPSGHMPQWTGYVMGGLGIAMSVGLGILMPVAAIGAGAGLAAGTASIVGSVAVGVLGATSGSLQIAGTAHPANKNLAISGDVFGVLNGVASLLAGGAVSAESVSVLTGRFVLNGLMMVSGISGAASGVFGGIASGINIVMDTGLSHESGFSTAINVLNDITSGFMAISILASVGAGIKGARMPGSGTSGKGGCFTGETRVMTGDGKQLAIRDIKTGMRVRQPVGTSERKKKGGPALGRVSFTGYQHFPQQNPIPGDCVITHIDGKSPVLRCPVHITLLRPWKQIRLWQKEQRVRGHVLLAFSDFGIGKLPLRITSVEAFDEKSDSPGQGQRVTGTFMHYTNRFGTYHFMNVRTGHTFTIHATPDHPFYEAYRHGFVKAEQLTYADRLLNAEGQRVRLLCPRGRLNHCGKEWQNHTLVPVYNLETGPSHRYLVGSEGLVVHNTCKLAEELRLMIPEHIITHENNDYLVIKHVHELQRVWSALRANNEKGAWCDSFSILTASMVQGKRVLIADLAALLEVKETIMHIPGGGTVPADHPYMTCLAKLSSVIGPLMENPGGTLETIIPTIGKSALIYTVHHAGVILRVSESDFLAIDPRTNGQVVLERFNPALKIPPSYIYKNQHKVNVRQFILL